MKKGILAALALSLALPACALGEAGYTAGTYSAEAQGMESAVKVTVTVSDSAITDLKHEHDCDRFHAAHDNPHWQDLIEHGKKLGIGQDTYELVTIR